MATKVGEFFIDLAVDAASGNLSVKQLVGALGELDVASVTSVGIFGKIADTLWSMAKAATGTAVELSALREVTGADPKLVEQWEKAAERIGVTSGSIIKSIQGVNSLMGAISLGKQGIPMEFGRLGIVPTKGVDSQGKPIMKDFFDLMKDLSNSKTYAAYTDQQKQQLLGGLPFSNKDDMFRIIKQMQAGNFKPETMQGLTDKQVSGLTDVSRQWTEVKQEVVDIFDKFLTGTDGVTEMLAGVKDLLVAVKDLLDLPQVKGLLHGSGEVVKDVGGAFKDIASGEWAKRFKEPMKEDPMMRYVSNRYQPQGSSVGPEINGKLDINILGDKGNPLGRTQVHLKRSVKNADVEHTTINAGNGGLGQ